MATEEYARLNDALALGAQELTRRAGGDESWEPALGRLSAAAVRVVPGAAYVGLTTREPDGSLASRAPTDPAIVELDRLQVELGEGPCVTALVEGADPVVVDDVATDARWPLFARAAVERGIGSLISFPLHAPDSAPSALNVYATAPHAFDESARAIAAAFAAQATVALHGARRIADLKVALASRDVIGQAKGILMERFDLDAGQAFELLVDSSQRTNIKLAEVARWLVAETEAGHTDRGPVTR